MKKLLFIVLLMPLISLAAPIRHSIPPQPPIIIVPPPPPEPPPPPPPPPEPVPEPEPEIIMPIRDVATGVGCCFHEPPEAQWQNETDKIVSVPCAIAISCSDFSKTDYYKNYLAGVIEEMKKSGWYWRFTFYFQK